MLPIGGASAVEGLLSTGPAPSSFLLYATITFVTNDEQSLSCRNIVLITQVKSVDLLNDVTTIYHFTLPTHCRSALYYI